MSDKRDKNDKKKKKGRSITVSVAVTSVLALVAAVIGWFGVLSCRESIRRKTDETMAFRREIADMRATIASRDATQAQAAETLRAHASLKGAFLEPLLDSYAMRVKTMVESEADALELTGVQFSNVSPVSLLPPTVPASKSPYVRRSVRVSAFGSYQRLASFLCRVERLFPMMMTDSVSITTEGGANGTQRGEFVFSWLSAKDGEVAP